MSSPKIHLEINDNIVYLMQNSKSLGGISSTELGTNANDVLNAYNKIAQKYDLKPDIIQEIIRIVLTQGRIIDFGGCLLSFCYWCNYLEEVGTVGVSNLVKSIKRRRSYEDILSDAFIAEIAAKYAKGHKVELKVKKKEKGCDLVIDNLKCDCKIRLGWLNQNSKDLACLEIAKEKPLNELAKCEINRIMKNRVIDAFLKQNAEIVFIDTKRTSVGISQITKNIFDSNKTPNPNVLPALKRYMVIFYARHDGKGLWASTWVPPRKINHLKQIMKRRIA